MRRTFLLIEARPQRVGCPTALSDSNVATRRPAACSEPSLAARVLGDCRRGHRTATTDGCRRRLPKFGSSSTRSHRALRRIVVVATLSLLTSCVPYGTRLPHIIDEGRLQEVAEDASRWLVRHADERSTPEWQAVQYQRVRVSERTLRFSDALRERTMGFSARRARETRSPIQNVPTARPRRVKCAKSCAQRSRT